MLGKATILAASLGALGLIAAGCGGGKPSPGVAALGPATTTTPAQNAAGGAQGQGPAPGGDRTAFVAFVNCMQKHGIQAQLGQGGQGVSISGGGGKNSPQFAAAQKDCQKLLPGGGPQALSPAQQAQNVKQLVKLAACMRTHGFPSFPDPTSQGVFNLSAANGFDPNSPQFQSAMNACHPRGARLRIGIRFAGPAPGG
jgi:hypothetical protein